MVRRDWEFEGKDMWAYVIQWRHRKTSHLNWLVDPKAPQATQHDKYFAEQTILAPLLDYLWQADLSEGQIEIFWILQPVTPSLIVELSAPLSK